MAYQFFQVVGLEKPSDLRRARVALCTGIGHDTICWMDPVDQVAWVERPGEPFTDSEVARTAGHLHDAGFWALPIDQKDSPGPTCIGRHRRNRFIDIRRRFILTLVFGLPVVLLHLWLWRGAGELTGRWPLALLWAQLGLTAAACWSAAGQWFHHGLRSLTRRRWRWRTGVVVVLGGCLLLAGGDILSRSFVGRPMLAGRPFASLLAPAVVVLALVLCRAMLLRWRLGQMSEPFDEWLARMSEGDQGYLRFFLRMQARHQRSGLDLSWGRLADWFSDLGLLAAAGTFAAVWAAFGGLWAAWLTAAGFLLLLDPRLFQLTWMAPEVLAERQALALGIFFSNPRVFQMASRLTAVVFDKAGTVTSEPAELVAVQVNPLAAVDLDGDELLRLAASVEQGADHAVARALVAAARQRGLTLATPRDIVRQPGMGVAGDVDGRHVLVGSEHHMAAEGLDVQPFEPEMSRLKREQHSVILVAVDRHIAGAIAVSDVLRPGAAQAVSDLRQDGLGVRLITGDSAAAGVSLAAQLAIPEVAVELSPEGKLNQVARWRRTGRLAVVLQAGKNPELADSADVSIALSGEAPEADRPAAPRPERHDTGQQASPGQTLADKADVHVLGNKVELVPAALSLARRVRSQRQRGFAWILGLLAVAGATAVLWPRLLVGAEWAPAVVAALTLTGLPVILGRSAIHSRGGPTGRA